MIRMRHHLAIGTGLYADAGQAWGRFVFGAISPGSVRFRGSSHYDQRGLVGREAWMPSREVITQQTVDHMNPDLQQLMCALRIPSHLLRL